MGKGSGLYEKPRAADCILDAWEEDRRLLMTEEEWLALSDDRRREILLMYERLKRKRLIS